MKGKGDELEEDLKQAVAPLERAEAELKAAGAAEEAARHEIHEALQEIKEAKDHNHEIQFEIIVNGRKKVVTTKELSFAEIVALAFDTVPTGPNILFTITYRHGPHGKSEGTLMEGATVKTKEGMIFNVTPTNKS
ncbi:MAG: multiubiquitin domain-containing protein [Geobacteraceae bacterium]